MKYAYAGIAILAVISVVFIYADQQTEELPLAPNFSLQDFSGNTVALSDFSGRIVFVNVWASWCPFCIKELPDMAALQKEFPDTITVIAINRQESRATAKMFADELGIASDILFLLDPDDSFYKSVGGFSMPETLFIDGERVIRIHKRGPMDLDEMREKIYSILN